MTWASTGLDWVPTSPHIPHGGSPAFYAATGIFGELGQVNEGVGFDRPFELAGAPWIDGEKLAARLNALNLEGVRFRPITYKPYYGTHAGKTCQGVQIFLEDDARANLVALNLYILDEIRKLHPDRDIFASASKDQIAMFDKVCGTDTIRKRLQAGQGAAAIVADWKGGVEKFKKQREKYLLYE